MNIKELIEKEESETLEFKKSTAQLEKALKSICGFCMCLAEAKKTTRFHEINTRRGYYAEDIG